MRECYHKECDRFNISIATEDKYDFMTSLVQSLVLSVAEMAMDTGMDTMVPENSKCISDTIEYLAEKQASKPVSKVQETRECKQIKW